VKPPRTAWAHFALRLYVVGTVVLGTIRAGASPPSGSGQGQRTALEQSLVEEALEHHQLVLDTEPSGKTVVRVEVYVAPVLDDRDPIPNFLNVFHVTTRDFIVRQEVLQPVGKPWDLGRVLETERNLRSLRQFSVANVVAARGPTPDSVVLLVVVKDVWSLRLNSSWGFGSSGLNYLLLNPTEENLAGLRATVGGYFLLERDRYALGATLAYPRLPGTRLSVSISGGVYLDRSTDQPEGSYGGLQFALPQFSRYSRWAYGTTVSYRLQVARRYRGSYLDYYRVDVPGAEAEYLPWKYHDDQIEGTYYGIRSFGVARKLDVEFGVAVDYARYRVMSDVDASSEAIATFESDALPVSDTKISPYVSLSAYETRFFRTTSVESLGLQEDYRLGYGLVTTLFVATQAVGSSRDLVGGRSSLGYTFALGDSLLRVGASNRIVVANSGKNEGHVSASARAMSPFVGVGRFHVDGYWAYRYQDYLNVSRYGLGGNNRLRGYPANSFYGKNLAAVNVEYRTRGVDVLSAQVGLVAFYDVAGVADDISTLEMRQGTGAGLRVVFPQAERTVLRLDWGIPLSGDLPQLPGSIYFTFGQAFPVPGASGGGSPFSE